MLDAKSGELGHSTKESPVSRTSECSANMQESE